MAYHDLVAVASIFQSGHIAAILPSTTILIWTYPFRKALIEAGIFHFPAATKQGSLSAAHSE